MSARAVELTGFEAGLVSSAAVSYSMTSLPDIGLLTADEMISIVTRIHTASPLALIIDCESGYGDSPLHAYRTVRRLALAGASAVMISDQGPNSGVERVMNKGEWGEKTWSQFKSLSKKEWLAKIKASLEAVKGTDCMVIARTESFYSLGLDEAISRSCDALQLGADIILICGITKKSQLQQINERIPGWKMYPDIVSTNGVPDVEVDTMMEYGFNLVTLHCVEKGQMWGMLEYAERTMKDQNTIWIDQKDMADRGVFHWFAQVPVYCDFKSWLDFEQHCIMAAESVNET
jgi:2-methylisocitrate lyase-like PEP mutase family enzyme